MTSDPLGDQIRVQWTIDDNLTDNLVKTSARLDICKMLEVIAASDLRYSSVSMEGSFPMADVYGRQAETIVVEAVYSRATIQKINWDSFLDTNAYLVADTAEIHPAFQ